MAEEQARADILARSVELYEAVNRDDYDAVASIYTEDAALMPHGSKVANGNQDVKVTLQSMLPRLKPLKPGDLFFFELLNDTTAYSNAYLHAVDENDKTKALFKDCLLWRKIDGVWHIARDIFNAEPMPEAPKAT